jgi:hypothetical protein
MTQPDLTNAEDLVPGKIYKATFDRCYPFDSGIMFEFIEYRDKHCQLHGEFIGKEALFRKIKASGKPSTTFSVLIDQIHIIEEFTP